MSVQKVIGCITILLALALLPQAALAGKSGKKSVQKPTASQEATSSLQEAALDHCKMRGDHAAWLAEMRDQGASLIEMLRILDKRHAAADLQAKDEEVKAFLRALREWVEASALLLYEKRWITPTQARQDAELQCWRDVQRHRDAGTPSSTTR